MDIKEETDYQAMMECIELGKLHYEEVESKNVDYRFDKNMATMLLNNNLLSIVTARQDGELIGYYAALVTPDMFTSTLVSREIGIFLLPEYRKLGLGTEMRKHSEEVARYRGCSLCLMTFKEGHDPTEAIVSGYEKTETVWQKVLED